MKFCMRLFTCQTVFVPPVLWSSAVGSPGNKRWCSWWKINRETHSVKCCSEPPEAQDTYSPKFLWSLLYFSNQKENQIAHLPAFARNEEHLVMYNYGCILIIIRYDTYVELYMYIIYNDVCIYIYIRLVLSDGLPSISHVHVRGLAIKRVAGPSLLLQDPGVLCTNRLDSAEYWFILGTSGSKSQVALQMDLISQIQQLFCFSTCSTRLMNSEEKKDEGSPAKLEFQPQPESI